jgi:hypothetical protein
MINIKRFIDRVASVDSRQGKDVVIPLSEARGLRDELAKLLIDKAEELQNKPEEVIQVQITGGSFK